MRIFKVGRPVKSIQRGRHGILLWEQGLARFFRQPYVELAFFVFRIGVDGGVVTAFRRLHFAHHPRGGFGGDLFELRVAADAPRVAAKAQQRPVVVEHFLEMRNHPILVHAVAREAAAEVIIDPAAGHFF